MFAGTLWAREQATSRMYAARAATEMQVGWRRSAVAAISKPLWVKCLWPVWEKRG
jgi:hypothetical protein